VGVAVWIHIWSSCLFFCQYHAVFVAMALLYSLDVVIPAVLLFLLSIALDIQSFVLPNEL
jgi:hypothetical protein